MSARTSEPAKVSCGVLGAGSLGGAIAERLAGRGFGVHAHDRDSARLDALREVGVDAAGSPRALAASSEAVLVLLPDTPDILACLAGEEGLQAGLRPGSSLLLLSTVDPQTPPALAERLSPAGVAVLDTPVSGGPVAAREGTLAIMVGADEDSYARCLPVLRALGDPVHVGPVGHGEIAKLAHNLIGATIALAIGEGLALAAKAGADIERVREAIGRGTAANRLLAEWMPRTVLSGDTDAHFSVDLMCKDQELIRRYAASLGVPLRAGEATRSAFEQARDAGYGDRDFSVLLALLAREAGAPPLPLKDPL